MNPFLLDGRARLNSWKALRDEITGTPDPIQKIGKALQFWRLAPIENPVIDWDNSQSWPTAWELLHNNRFCESALSLGVAYTLLLSDPEIFSNLAMMLITHRLYHVQKIVLLTHNQVLNLGYLDQQPVSIIAKAQIHTRWRFDGKSWNTLTQ